MSKHTPGPWAVDPDDRNGMEWNRHIVQADNPNMRICFMTSDGKEADARLIAAAPDMLQALVDMLAWADTPTEEASPSWIIGACHRARAAIAKAEGSA